MGRLGAYKVDLKGLENDRASYNWTVDQDFFSLVEGEDVVRVIVTDVAINSN